MCPPLVEIGLTDLPKTGGAKALGIPRYNFMLFMYVFKIAVAVFLCENTVEAI